MSYERGNTTPDINIAKKIHPTTDIEGKKCLTSNFKKTLTGIVPSRDPTLKSCRFRIKFFGLQRFVYRALKTGDPKNDIPEPAHRSWGGFL